MPGSLCNITTRPGGSKHGKQETPPRREPSTRKCEASGERSRQRTAPGSADEQAGIGQRPTALRKYKMPWTPLFSREDGHERADRVRAGKDNRYTAPEWRKEGLLFRVHSQRGDDRGERRGSAGGI